MAKQQLSVDVQLTPTRTPLIRRRPAPPPPGGRLREAVGAVLSELDKESATLSLPQLDDILRAALAWTAATGDTCRVASAVLAVRTARTRLGMAEPDQAKLALVTAQDRLDHPVPSQRDAT